MASDFLTTLQGDEFQSAVANGVTLVDFWAPWCQPCRTQSTILEQVAQTMGDRARICMVNVDENPALAELCQIQGIPTLILFKNGVGIKQFIGVQTAEDLLEVLENSCRKNKE
jgi:thioredoxin